MGKCISALPALVLPIEFRAVTLAKLEQAQIPYHDDHSNHILVCQSTLKHIFGLRACGLALWYPEVRNQKWKKYNFVFLEAANSEET